MAVGYNGLVSRKNPDYKMEVRLGFSKELRIEVSMSWLDNTLAESFFSINIERIKKKFYASSGERRLDLV